MRYSQLGQDEWVLSLYGNQGYFVEKNFLPENLRKELLFNYFNSKGYFLKTNLKLFEFIKIHYSNIINNYLGKSIGENLILLIP